MVLPQRVIAAAVALLAFAGCTVAELPPRSDGASQPDVAVDTASAEPAWIVVHDGLPGTLLSVCGAGDERWAVGADAGAGPLVFHREGGVWSPLVTGTSGHLWWVACMDDGGVVMVGDGGLILRKRAAEEDFEALSIAMDVPLYGVWGPSVDDFYVVGGATDARNGPGVAFRVKGSVVTPVAGMPAALSPTAAFFKVWGSGPDDVWIVGEGGTVLHGGESGWSLELLPDAARLVTVHGDGDLVMAVGGASDGLAFEHTGGVWSSVDVGQVGIIQGVHVAAGGLAVVAGLNDVVLARRAGVYSTMGPTPAGRDWHGVWIGPAGDVWLAGGLSFQPTAAASGALLCFGTAATCGGTGGGTVAEPTPDAGVEPVADAAGDTGAEIDSDAASDSQGDAEVADDAEVDAPDASDDGEVGPDSDAMPETDADSVSATDADADAAPDADAVPDADAAPDADADADAEIGPDIDAEVVSDAAPDANGGTGQVSSGDFPLAVARFDDFGVSVPLLSGDSMKVYFGPQGGTHLEVGGIFEVSGLGSPVNVVVSGTISVDGAQVGNAPQTNWPATLVASSYVLAYYVRVAFSGLASDSPPIGSDATLCMNVTLSDQRQAKSCVDILLSAD
ncbi:MAG: hypothetical protein R3F39_11160 [Myxococcota bacterium]